MQGYRFYLEHASRKDKRKNNHNGNVIALDIENGYWIDSRKQCMRECVSAVYFYPNSPVCGSNCSMEYIQDNCKRISESKARDIHPLLFSYLDNEGD